MKNVLPLILLAFLTLLMIFYFVMNHETDRINYLADGIVEEINSSHINLIQHSVSLTEGEKLDLLVPRGFQLNIAADNLGKARFMAWSPDGNLFVPDMVDYNLSNEGRLFVLSDFDEESGQFKSKHVYLSGLRGPNSVAFYTDSDGKHWLYLALTEHLIRYPYEPGDTKPSSDGEVIAEFPNQQSPGETSVVWHITRTIFFNGDRLYVSVGSGCNACEELAGSMRAMIYSMDPLGQDQRVEGEGLRNTVGIAMAEEKLYATLNGVDHLGANAPEEALYLIEEKRHYGWPYCYLVGGKMIEDQNYFWEQEFDCTSVPAPLTTFNPRSAPLGLRYFNADSHPLLANSFLVAIHGSFDASLGIHPEIRRVTLSGENEIFIDGLTKDGERVIRPVDFLQKDRDSFFFSDDHGGRIFYVTAH